MSRKAPASGIAALKRINEIAAELAKKHPRTPRKHLVSKAAAKYRREKRGERKPPKVAKAALTDTPVLPS